MASTTSLRLASLLAQADRVSPAMAASAAKRETAGHGMEHLVEEGTG